MAKQLEDILDDCIAAIIVGGATVEQCLARYPRQAAELRELLRLTARLAGVAALDLSPAAKLAGWRRLNAKLEALRATPSRPADAGRPAQPLTHLRGTLTTRSQTQWAIGGKPMKIQTGASVIGELQAGVEVAALGGWLEDGVFIAAKVMVLQPGGS